ncbi:MAG: hypothetical protein ACYTGH_16815, partial [Planctomycetota bacterium]
MAMDNALSAAAKVKKLTLSRKTCPCPVCGTTATRHSNGKRTLRDVGISSPSMLEVIYSKHFCKVCMKHFSIPMEHIAPPSSRFTNRVRQTAVALITKKSMTLEVATNQMLLKYHVKVPASTLHDWVVADMDVMV